MYRFTKRVPVIRHVKEISAQNLLGVTKKKRVTRKIQRSERKEEIEIKKWGVVPQSEYTAWFFNLLKPSCFFTYHQV
jgi:hypothetical protein